MSPIIYKAIRRFIDKKNRTKFVIEVINEILVIKTAFENDIMSEKEFSADTWNSWKPDIKRKIFNEYKDYLWIDEFYSEVSKRDSFLMQHDSALELHLGVLKVRIRGRF